MVNSLLLGNVAIFGTCIPSYILILLLYFIGILSRGIKWNFYNLKHPRACTCISATCVVWEERTVCQVVPVIWDSMGMASVLIPSSNWHARHIPISNIMLYVYVHVNTYM